MSAPGSIKNLMETTLESIKSSIDANTIVGDPIKTDTTVVIPISKVTVGFGIGGGEYSKGYTETKSKKQEKVQQQDDTNFAGGSAGAISMQPVAFVVVENGETLTIAKLGYLVIKDGEVIIDSTEEVAA